MKKIDFIRILPCFVGKLLYYRRKEYQMTNACQYGDSFINDNIIIDKCFLFISNTLPPICLLISLLSLCALQVDAQSLPSHLGDHTKDTLSTISPVLIQKVREALLQTAPITKRVGDGEITELTNTILDKTPVETGLRPYALRIDFPQELVRLTSDGIDRKLVPQSLTNLMKPQPFTYNMCVACCNVWWINPVEWIVVDVPEFHVSDYDIDTSNNNWFWAEDWR